MKSNGTVRRRVIKVMDQRSLAEYASFAEDLAHEAGIIARKYFAGVRASTRKSDNSFLTKADTQINDLVIERISARFPGHSVIGEEASKTTESKYVWVCDPIDGTAPFVQGLPYSCFEIALVVDGVPQVAVIYDLINDRLYAAQKGRGATLDGDVITVSRTADIAQAITAISSSSSPDIDAPRCRMDFDRQSYRLMVLQCTSRDATLVASGAFEIGIFVGTNVHDVAAPMLLVEEAGGKTSDIYGNPQRYDQPVKGMLFTNGLLHKTALDIITNSLLLADGKHN